MATYLGERSYECSCLRQRTARDWEVLMGQSSNQNTFSHLDSRLCQHRLKVARHTRPIGRTRHVHSVTRGGSTVTGNAVAFGSWSAGETGNAARMFEIVWSVASSCNERGMDSPGNAAEE